MEHTHGNPRTCFFTYLCILFTGSLRCKMRSMCLCKLLWNPCQSPSMLKLGIRNGICITHKYWSLSFRNYKLLNEFQLPLHRLHPFLSLFSHCFACKAMQALYSSIELQVRILGSQLGADTNLLACCWSNYLISWILASQETQGSYG